MQHQTAKRLHDALRACEELEHFTTGVSEETFLEDRGLQLIVHKLLEIVGEALRQASRSDDTVVTQIPDLELIVGTRNRITHGYHSVDYQVLWSISQMQVPALRERLASLLSNDEDHE